MQYTYDSVGRCLLVFARTLTQSPCSSETQLSQLLLSPLIKVAFMTTTSVDTETVDMMDRDGIRRFITVPWYNRTHDMEGYYYWVATALDYKIEVHTYTVSPSVPSEMYVFC
jgi:hypothetical protein